MKNISNIISIISKETRSKKIKLYKSYINKLHEKYDNCYRSRNENKCRDEYRKRIRYWKRFIKKLEDN